MVDISSPAQRRSLLQRGSSNAQSSASSLFTPINIADAGLGGLSALASIQAGRAQAQNLRTEAAFERFNAEQEFINARARANEIGRIREELVGSVNASYAANGVDLSSDTAIIAAGRVRSDAGRAASAERLRGELNRSIRKTNAQNLLIQAKNARDFAILNGIFSLGTSFLNIAGRG